MITLSPRQQQVYGLMIQGYGYKQIATELGITERTVNAHITSMREKMHCITNAQMVYKIEHASQNTNSASAE